MADRAMYPGGILSPVLQIGNADGTTVKTFNTASGLGNRVSNISATSTNTANVDLLIYHSDGTTNYLIGRVTIPAGAGSNGTEPAVAILNKVNMPFLDDDLCFFLQTGHSLKIAASVAVLATKTIDISGVVGVY